jgi:hypothetical protein
VVHSESLDQGAHEGSGKSRLRHDNFRETLAYVRVDIRDALFAGDLGKV